MAEWTYHISLAVTDQQQRILLLPTGEHWMPPRFTQDKFFTHLYLLTRRIQDELAADMVVLRPLISQQNDEAHVMNVLLLMDNQTTEWKPPQGSRWVDRAGLDEVVLAEEWMRPALEQALDKLNQPPPAARPPWFTSGWFAQASEWMSQTLIHQGYHLLRPPEPFKHGTISSVLRAETSTGSVYFKEAIKLPLFGNEPKLSVALGQLYPDVIQAPLAIDEARRWMLTADIGTELRQTSPDLERLQSVVKKFARLQIASALHIDTLFDAGCLDRRLDVLSNQIDSLLADEGCCALLNADEQAEWQASREPLKALCQQLADVQLPYTLVHGDFHGGNIALQDQHIRFFDWTDACVAHPFFDLAPLTNSDEPERTFALREAYLAEWTAYESLDRLRQAYSIAMILGALHQSMSYQGIFNGVQADQQFEWASGVSFYIRRVLKLMRKPIEPEKHS